MSARGPYSIASGGLLALAAAIGVGRFVYTPILPPMMAALRLDHASAGLIASANFAGYLAGALLAARPDLGGSRRAWLLASLLVSAATTAGMGLSASMPVFLVLRFTGGIASALAFVFASTIVLERLTNLRRVGLSAMYFAGVGAGIAVSAVLLGANQPWQVLWLMSGALSLAATLAVAVLIDDEPAPVVARTAATDVRHPGLRSLVAAYGLFGFGYVTTATFLVAIVRASPRLRPAEPLVWVVFGLSAAPSVAIWTRLALLLGIPRTFALACVVEAAGVLASIVWTGETGVFLSAVLVGGTFMGLTALGLVLARSLAQGSARRALGVMTASFGVGQIVGPSFAGFAAEWFGSFQVPLAVAVVALLTAAALVLMAPRLRRPHPASAAAGGGPPTQRAGPWASASSRRR
jgi:predicted MFS family arabinose efflux permease